MKRPAPEVTLNVPWMYCDCTDCECTSIACKVFQYEGKQYMVGYLDREQAEEESPDACDIQALTSLEVIDEYKRRNLAEFAKFQGNQVSIMVGGTS
jgi:hypothetical protein